MASVIMLKFRVVYDRLTSPVLCDGWSSFSNMYDKS